MPVKTQDDAVKLQKDFLNRVTKAAETLREGRTMHMPTLLKEGKERITAAKARLDSATKDRDEMVRRMDERIARLADDVKRLEASLDEVQKRTTQENSKPRGSKRPTRPS